MDSDAGAILIALREPVSHVAVLNSSALIELVRRMGVTVDPAVVNLTN